MGLCVCFFFGCPFCFLGAVQLHHCEPLLFFFGGGVPLLQVEIVHCHTKPSRCFRHLEAAKSSAVGGFAHKPGPPMRLKPRRRLQAMWWLCATLGWLSEGSRKLPAVCVSLRLRSGRVFFVCFFSRKRGSFPGSRRPLVSTKSVARCHGHWRSEDRAPEVCFLLGSVERRSSGVKPNSSPRLFHREWTL